ncbi:MAG: triphosphoribosyl-dephospho-CoA synthase [Candidatus Bathyarchaeia archaeon]
MSTTWKRKIEIADQIMVAGQLAATLEVCGWPKPGNVHRTSDFPDTRFEHFIAGSISLGPVLWETAFKAVSLKLGETSEVKIGSLIKRAVLNVKAWHRGGNTHLGVILLFIPMAAAVGMTLAASSNINIPDFRENFARIMESTTCEDATEVYDAISQAGPGGMGQVLGGKAPDLQNSEAERLLLEGNLTLYDVMEVAAEWDTIARELVSSLPITCTVGFPILQTLYSESKDINVATVHTYLKLLSLYPDSFIARKVGLKYTSNVAEAVKIGMKTAEEISEKAGKILQLGGLKTPEGRRELFKFDVELKMKKLNPGTTADLTASSLMLAILNGLRF